MNRTRRLQEQVATAATLLMACLLGACNKTETLTVVVPGTTDTGAGGSGDIASPDAEAPDVVTAGDSNAPDVAQPEEVVTADFTVACPPEVVRIGETEPNDHWSSSNDAGKHGSPGFCIQTSVLCGKDETGAYANPGDHFVFELAAAATVDFELRWDAPADFDLLISPDFESDTLTVTYKNGIGVEEGGKANINANTPYYISINCFDGTPGDAALIARW